MKGKKLTTAELLRKAELIQRLVIDIGEYYIRWGEAMPLRFASARYARALCKLGGFPETIQELEFDGSVIIEHYRTGKRLIYPAIGFQVKKKYA